ncbi:PKD domain-containing protein [Sediminicola sp. 1XM1-17]|uniref:PKD domain-containing protein n=1 Tax=Sediminicola sp. 1XM1-17 TaxID=3127702 RepID=UPI0030784885
MMKNYAIAKRRLLLCLFLTFSFYGISQSFNASGLIGENLANPTSLDFGPNGKLYVTQQDGTLLEYTVARDNAPAGSGAYSVSSSATINIIKTGVPNHNDDGTVNTANTRQVTGIMTAGTASQPVLYVSSSDSRIGGGPSTGDTNLDTNSGVLSRLTWNGSTWDKVDLVRGLPRCEENHSTNGMDMFQLNGNTFLLLQQGGNTNRGAPSNNFAGTSETYLSGALLIINLTQLEQMEAANGGPYVDTRQGSTKYIYDLPTLNDPTRADITNASPNFPYSAGHPLYNATIDIGDPFGGNDGLNQAFVEQGGPVQIFSPGYRNAYDVVITADGRIYSGDNGPNTTWGGLPVIYTSAGNKKGNQSTTTYDPANGDYVTNEFNESGSTGHGDALHFVGTINDANGTYYGGHTAPIRAFPSRAGVVTHEYNGSAWVVDNSFNFENLLGGVTGYFNTSFSITDFPDDPRQGENLAAAIASPKVNILDIVNSSTNGMCEYTASNFGGAMFGDLLTASFNGKINRYELNAAGDALLAKNNSFLDGFGSTPLDIIAQGDEDPFPGTIWAATYGADNITIFEPTDFGACPQPGDAGYDPLADNDSDGYTNQDEIDNGTNICSGGSKPTDNDGDFVSDLNDPDDDNDGILDVSDAFAIDATNGTSLNLPVQYPFWNNDPGTGFFGLGFTGLMLDPTGATDYLNQYDPENLSFGGAGGKATIDAVDEGNALEGANTQNNAFQFGVNVDTNSAPFTVHAKIETPFSGNPPTDFQSYGIYIGNGDQDNYLKVALMDGTTNGDGIDGFEVILENGGVVTSQNTFDVPGLIQASSADIYISIDPSLNTAQPYYSIDGGETIMVLGSPINLPASFLDPNDSFGMAVGIIGTSAGPGDEFTATWDFINITENGPPNLTFEPNPLDFGTLATNSGEAQLIAEVRNGGGPATGSIQVTDISFTGSDAALFSNNSTLPIIVGAGGTKTLPISFFPDSNAGSKSANIVITHTGVNSPLTVPLTAILTDIVVVARVNAGGNGVTANDGNLDWEFNGATGAYTGTTYNVNTGSITTGNLVYANRDASIPPYISETTFDALFLNERFDEAADPEMLFNFPIGNGLYQVNLFMGNSFSGTSAVGQRVFDVHLEGVAVQEDIDLISEFGHQVGGVLSFIVPVSDGTLNIEFLHQLNKNNPLINAIEILDVSNKDIAFGIFPVEDQLTVAGKSVAVEVNAYGGDSNEPVVYSISGQPSGLSIDSATGIISGIADASGITGGPNGDGIHTVTVTASKNGSSDVQTQFTWTVTPFSSYRINSGGNLVIATDGETNWESNNVSGASSSENYSVNTGIITNSGLQYTNRHASIPTYISQSVFNALFSQERYDVASGPEMEYQIPLSNGNYTVNLYLGNSFSGTSQIGQRVFDVLIENTVVKDNLDLIAEFGHLAGGMLSFEVTLTDGVLNIGFGHVVENPLINAIEILSSTGEVVDFEIIPIADQSNVVGQTVSVSTSTTGGDPNESVSYAITGQPQGISINTATGLITGTLPATAALEGPNGDGIYNVTVSASKTGSQDVQTQFIWTVSSFTTYRINAAGALVVASDGDTDWEANDTSGAFTSQNYSVNTGVILNANLQYANRDASIPAYIDQSTFNALFAQERYDTPSGEEMEFVIPLLNGNYEVNIYLGNSFAGTNTVGDRIFDIEIEGTMVRDNLDLISEFGHQAGGMLSFPVSVQDGNLNIRFLHEVENPLVNAIEIRVDNSQYPPIFIDPIADQDNQVGESSTISVGASGGDPNANFTYSISGQPVGINIEPTNGQIFGTINADASEGGPNGDGIHLVTVVVTKPGSQAVSVSFNWTVGYQWINKDEDENYTARHENSFVQAGNKFYLMGGRENAKTIDIYDYTTNTWTSLQDSAPFEFNHFQATEYQGLIWVIGAFKSNNYPNEVPADFIWAFDPSTNEWIQGPEIPAGRKRGSTGLVVHNNKFYIIAGNTNGHNPGYIPWFDEYDPATGVWTPLGDAPRARDHFHASVIDNKLYIAGGRLSAFPNNVFNQTIAEVDVYDFASGTWSTLPSGQNLPTPRGGAAVANINDKLLVIGGEVQNQDVYGVQTTDALKITEQYNPVNGTWTRLADLNNERHGTQAIVSGNGVYILGGSPNLAGGNQKNMEYLGADNATGVASIASELVAPSLIDISEGSQRDIILNAEDGNIGVFIRSMELSGPDAADFSIDAGNLTNFLIAAQGQHTITVGLTGTGTGRSATLTINYGTTSTLEIQLTTDNTAPVVTNPGTQYNNEGDSVALQIVANDASSNLSYSATGLPPTLTIDPITGLISGTVSEGGTGNGAFQEENGLVVIEAESATLDPTWSITTLGGATGIIAGSNHFSNQNGGTLTYDINITTPGVYRFNWRSFYSGGSPTDENDNWLRFPNNDDVWFFGFKGTPGSEASVISNLQGSQTNIVFPGGSSRVTPATTPEGSSSNGYLKIYRSGGASQVYSWQAYTSDNDAHNIYVYFVNPGTYQMEVSERSAGHAIDKMALYKLDGTAYSNAQLTAAPESPISQGTNGAADNSPYNVQVVVEDDANPAGSSTIDFQWIIGEAGNPLAVASAIPLSGDVPLEVSFTGSDSTDDVGIVSYAWDFKDGNTSTEADPLHIFTSAGTYDVTLTVTDGDGNTGSTTITIQVNDPANEAPVAVATSDVSNGDAPLTVAFTGSNSTDDVGVTSYLWDFGDAAGSTSTEADPSFVFTEANTYTITLTVTDGEGLTNSTTLEITVNVPNEAPVAVATSDVSNGDAPLTVAFTGSNSTDDVGVVSYLWDFGDAAGSTSMDADPSFVFTEAGVFTVTLTVTDEEGLTSSTTLEITVNAPNEAPVAIATSDVTSGDAPLIVAFTGSNSTDDVDITSYLWDFGDAAGSTSSEADPSFTFTEAGTYTVSLTVTDEEGLTGTATLEIIVNAPNGAPVAVATSDVSNGDAPLTVAFTGSNSTDDVGIESYLWQFGDAAGSTSTEANPSFVFTEAGVYTVTLTVTDNDGLTDMATLEITVNDPVDPNNEAPVAAITANPINGIAPLPVLFSAEDATDDKGIVRYEWDFNDGTTSTVRTNSAAFSHTFAQAGIYIVVLTVTDEEGLTGTATITITVSDTNAAPNAIATATPMQGSAPLEVTFNGSSSTDDIGILSYNWDFGDGSTSAEADPIHIYDAAGEYNVVLTVSDGEFTDTDTLTIVVTENIPSEVGNFEVIVAPNPVVDGTANIIMVTEPIDDFITLVYLHDASGRYISGHVAQTIYDAGNYKIPTYGLRTGIYYVTLLTEKGDSLGLKIMVKN